MQWCQSSTGLFPPKGAETWIRCSYGVGRVRVCVVEMRHVLIRCARLSKDCLCFPSDQEKKVRQQQPRPKNQSTISTRFEAVVVFAMPEQIGGHPVPHAAWALGSSYRKKIVDEPSAKRASLVEASEILVDLMVHQWTSRNNNQKVAPLDRDEDLVLVHRSCLFRIRCRVRFSLVGPLLLFRR